MRRNYARISEVYKWNLGRITYSGIQFIDDPGDVPSSFHCLSFLRSHGHTVHTSGTIITKLTSTPYRELIYPLLGDFDTLFGTLTLAIIRNILDDSDESDKSNLNLSES